MNIHRFSGLVFLVIILLVSWSCTGSDSGTSKSISGQEKQAGERPHKAMNLIPDAEKEKEMQEAALEGNGAIVTNLLKEGINPNSADGEGRTALMYAAFNGHIKIVEALLENSAVVDLRDAEGRTALLYASTGPFSETVKLLLEHNADPNIHDAVESFTPLMHAAAEGQVEVVRILLEYGADAGLKDVDGDTAADFAARNGHTAVVELLSLQ